MGDRFKGDPGNRHHPSWGKPLFQMIVFRLAVSQADSAASSIGGEVTRVVEQRPIATRLYSLPVHTLRLETGDSHAHK